MASITLGFLVREPLTTSPLSQFAESHTRRIIPATQPLVVTNATREAEFIAYGNPLFRYVGGEDAISIT
jgi:hypothetical protein